MRVLITIMVVMVAAVLFAGHWFLYYSWDYFFRIENCTISEVVVVVLSILAESFLATALLVHWRENSVTSWLYIIAGSWTGIAWNLMLATFATWLIDWIARLASFDIHIAIIAFIMYGMALAYSGYAIWNAQFPRVRRVSIAVRDLPALWEGRTAALLTDIHLGTVHHIRFARRIVTMIQKIAPDVILIGGDMYDGAGKELGLVITPLKDLKPPLGVYGVIGNHETYIEQDKAERAIEEAGIRLLRHEQVDVDGVQLIGVAYHRPSEKRDISKDIALIDRDKPTIVLYHEPAVKTVDALRHAGADVVLSGHTHKGQMWPFGFITKAIFKRYDCGLYVDGAFSQYTSTGVGTWGPPLRTGNRPEIVQITFKRYNP